MLRLVTVDLGVSAEEEGADPARTASHPLGKALEAQLWTYRDLSHQRRIGFEHEGSAGVEPRSAAWGRQELSLPFSTM